MFEHAIACSNASSEVYSKDNAGWWRSALREYAYSTKGGRCTGGGRTTGSRRPPCVPVLPGLSKDKLLPVFKCTKADACDLIEYTQPLSVDVPLCVSKTNQHHLAQFNENPILDSYIVLGRVIRTGKTGLAVLAFNSSEYNVCPPSS